VQISKWVLEVVPSQVSRQDGITIISPQRVPDGTLERNHPAPSLSAKSDSEKIYRGESYEETLGDWAFTKAFEDAFGDGLITGFYCKVADTTFANSDGSNRMQIVQQCQAGERLSLVPEPENPYDRNAIAVRRDNGQQLGYVPAHSASQIAPAMRRGKAWIAFFRRPGYDPARGQANGAVVLLLNLQPQLTA
jgi:hypothetical protein